MELTLITNQEEALELHQTILYNYRMAAHHLVDTAHGLKRMRDTKAYTVLGMDTFEQYTEQMAGINKLDPDARGQSLFFVIGQADELFDHTDGIVHRI